MKSRIDLRSDTVTVPTSEMWQAMLQASMGDSGYGEDESVNELEAYCANLFDKESALFTVSGTMSNQIAIRAHMLPGNEIILDKNYHVNFFESGATADLAKVHLATCDTGDGVLTVEHISYAMHDKYRSAFSGEPQLVCIENTINAYGGKVFPISTLKEVFNFSKQVDLKVHIDGARILNACIATGISPKEYAQYCDSICLCFSKGLAAPFGSILMGDQEFIKKAAKYKKWYGGGMHQSGIMAAAALHAIQNNFLRLEIDHQNAKLLAAVLSKESRLEISLENVETNIVMMKVNKLGVSAKKFSEKMQSRGVWVYVWNDSMIRAVTHMGIDEEKVKAAAHRILEVCQEF